MMFICLSIIDNQRKQMLINLNLLNRNYSNTYILYLHLMNCCCFEMQDKHNDS